MRTVIGYARASTEEQSLSPSAQRTAMERWCEAHDACLGAVHEDLGVSGGAPLDRRPGLLAALADLRATGAAGLLVARRDRLARDIVVAAMIERLVEREGARVLTADGTGNGDAPEHQLMRGVLDVFSQYERALIRSRTKAGLSVKRQRGERIGGVPFGYKLGADGVHLVEDAREQRVLSEILTLRAQGYSIRAVAEKLNALDRPARGERWHATSVARILKRAGEVAQQ